MGQRPGGGGGLGGVRFPSHGAAWDAPFGMASIRLSRWDRIPAWLWKGETNHSPEEFQDDHRECFENPADDFEFIGFEFELVEVLGGG